MITQDRLRELLCYDLETGVFTRRVRTSNSIREGSIAGGKSPTTGYWRISLDNCRYAAHRLAFLYMNGRWPSDQVDHIDHNRTNNSWVNLREVTHAENQKNRVHSSRNKSGVTGVTWDRARSKWYASIVHEGKTVSLGRHKLKRDAAKSRKKAEAEFGYHSNHGEMA